MKLVITENQLRGIVEMSRRAYHGGYYDFDKFETSKIGTGESTQIYGWGLYFSDRESVADSYAISVPSKKNLELKYNPELKYKGKIIKNLNFIGIKSISNYDDVGYIYGDGNFILDTLYDNVVKNLYRTILNYLKGIYGDNSRWEHYIPTKQKLVDLVKNKYEESLNNIENALDYEINDTYNSDDEISRLREKLNKEKKRYEDFINGRLTEENKIIDDISNLKREDFSLTSDDDQQKHGYVYDVTLHKNKTPDQYDYLSWPDYLTPNQKQKIINQIKTEKLKKKNFYIADPGIESTVEPAFFHSYEQAKDWVKQQNIKNSITGLGISMFNYTVEKGTFTKEDLNKTVGEFYKQLSGLLGSKKNASMFLLRAGIDGINDGFDVYVVFDPNAVTIEKKNKLDFEKDVINYY